MEDEHLNDARSRIIEDSGYGEYSFEESPYLEIYSNYRTVNSNIQRTGLTLEYMIKLCNSIVEMHPDQSVVQSLIDYLEANNPLIENIKEQVNDITEKSNTISDSDYNIIDLINDNSNNLDTETISSIEEFYKALSNESDIVVSMMNDFKEDILLKFKSAIDDCVTQSNMVQALVEDCGELFEDYVEALKEGDDVEINRLHQQLNQKINSNVNKNGNANSVEDISYLSEVDLQQELNNPNLLEVKDNSLISDVEFMEMLRIKGVEYAEEYIYTLPKENRDLYFKLMDL